MIVMMLLAAAVQEVVPPGELNRWISEWDYPKEAIAKQEQGEVGVRLEVDERGRLTACWIASSSGSSALDAATCPILRRRGVFKPSGLPGLEQPSVRVGKVDWRLSKQQMHPETLLKELDAAAARLERPAGPPP